MTEQTQSSQDFSRVRARARFVRAQFIDLTHEFPESGGSQELLRLWNVADTALMDFIHVLEQEAAVPRPQEKR